MPKVTKIVKENGIIEYRNEQGELYSEDGPAVIYPDGSAVWFRNGDQQWWGGRRGFLHREDGPAYVWDGYQAWWIDGRCHRVDGPAYIHPDGRQEWYLIGVKVDENLVKNLGCLTIDLIHKHKNVELRSWLIARMGWAKYLKEINAEPIDTRENYIENTKEALYKVKGIKGKQLIVTCPTGRVFNLHVPDRIKTCEQAQNWLGNDVKKKFNVIGRT